MSLGNERVLTARQDKCVEEWKSSYFVRPQFQDLACRSWRSQHQLPRGHRAVHERERRLHPPQLELQQRCRRVSGYRSLFDPNLHSKIANPGKHTCYKNRSVKGFTFSKPQRFSLYCAFYIWQKSLFFLLGIFTELNRLIDVQMGKMLDEVVFWF